MVRPLYAILGALALLLGWLSWVGYEAQWQPAGMVASLADSARRGHLPGLAARGNLLAAEALRRQLAGGGDRTSPEGRQLVARVIALRTAAARVLLDAGYVTAAEQVALAAARADYNDVDARTMLLETRLLGPGAEAARRELMLLLLRHEHPRVLYLLGLALGSQADTQDSEGYLRAARQLDPASGPTYLALARLALRRQDRALALEWLDQGAAAAIAPDDHRAVIRLRAEADPRYRPGWALVSLWWQEHWVTPATVAIYGLFLLAPLWVTALRRSGGT